MPTRMDRYYQNAEDKNSRTSRNAKLYDSIYDNTNYSNVEGIAKIEKTNEIDLSEITKFMKDHELGKETHNYLVKKVVANTPKYDEEENDNIYDLKQFLEEAKKDRPKEQKERYVKNIKYEILEKNLQKLEKEDIEEELSIDDLKQLKDNELSLGLLDNLKSSDNTMIEELPLRKKEEETMDLDSSFFTSSMKFDKQDFEELEDINKSIKKHSIWITLLVFILLVVIITSLLFLFQNVL